MNSIVKSKKSLGLFIKNIILKYCPYVESRLYMLSNYLTAPQLDIEISIDDNHSQIRFLFGNDSFKSSVPEQVTINTPLDFEEIGNIIDFILEDHEAIKGMDFNGKEISLIFSINWTNQSIKGINCGDIKLDLNFNSTQLKNKYLYLLIQKYYEYLQNVPSFHRIKNQYFDNMKKSYFSTMNKTQLLLLLNSMNEDELRELLYNLDNDLFLQYTNLTEQPTKERTLHLEKISNSI